MKKKPWERGWMNKKMRFVLFLAAIGMMAVASIAQATCQPGTFVIVKTTHLFIPFPCPPPPSSPTSAEIPLNEEFIYTDFYRANSSGETGFGELLGSPERIYKNQTRIMKVKPNKSINPSEIDFELSDYATAILGASENTGDGYKTVSIAGKSTGTSILKVKYSGKVIGETELSITEARIWKIHALCGDCSKNTPFYFFADSSPPNMTLNWTVSQLFASQTFTDTLVQYTPSNSGTVTVRACVPEVNVCEEASLSVSDSPATSRSLSNPLYSCRNPFSSQCKDAVTQGTPSVTDLANGAQEVWNDIQSYMTANASTNLGLPISNFIPWDAIQRWCDKQNFLNTGDCLPFDEGLGYRVYDLVNWIFPKIPTRHLCYEIDKDVWAEYPNIFSPPYQIIDRRSLMRVEQKDAEYVRVYQWDGSDNRGTVVKTFGDQKDSEIGIFRCLKWAWDRRGQAVNLQLGTANSDMYDSCKPIVNAAIGSEIRGAPFWESATACIFAPTSGSTTCNFWWEKSKCRGRAGAGCEGTTVNLWYHQDAHNHDFCEDEKYYGGMKPGEWNCHAAVPEAVEEGALSLGFTCPQKGGDPKINVLGLADLLP